ncbi:MAG: TauD/TfdA family dioxygenase [Alphaproteobacteria bacterium]|nr:TauD/TfdA family dioxygenase [Alphaproteobacteria bacterium]
MADGSSIEVIPSGAALGAEIAGLDLSGEVDDASFGKVLQAWADHLVLRFRGQGLDEEALLRFSRRFGALDPNPTRPVKVPNHPASNEINVISNILVNDAPIGGLGNSELVWHQDMSYKPMPPKASILYGVETPETGGDTWFYNLYTAYETLPDVLKDRIAGLSCKHDATRNSAGQLRAGFEPEYANQDRPGAIHPLVIRHPDTGRSALHLGRRPNAWIVGLSDAESDALLDDSWAHIEKGGHHWAQQWRPGDVVIWDNRCTLHRRGTLDPAQRRLMYRTQVGGGAPPVAA